MKKLFLLLAIITGFEAFSQSTLLNRFHTDTYGGPSPSLSSQGKLFFSAYDTIHGRELWCTDGTPFGTFMVKDIQPGINSGIGEYFELTSYDLNGIIYFRGNDGATGIELWRSDGTDAGTYLVKDTYAGPQNSAVGEFASVGNILYFTAGTGTSLWRSDGTSAGTYSIYSFNYISNLTGFNGDLYFAADDNNGGQELWKSDGTNSGTNLLKDLNAAFGASLPCNFYVTPSLLYFMANTNEGWELWKSDGTWTGTQIVKDIYPGGNNGTIATYSDAFMINIDDTVYFRATDGLTGYQLWRSDGTDPGTYRLTNIPDGVDASCNFQIANGKIMLHNYLSAAFSQYDLATGITSLSGFPYYYYFSNWGKYKFANDLLFYAGKDSLVGCEIWKSNGTQVGTGRLQETHLVDNWNTTAFQGFNFILGVTGNNLVFGQSRSPYNTLVPLYSYDVTNNADCFPPEVIVPVPISSSITHFVWNRTDLTTAYEFRYRIASTGTWDTINTSYSFTAINSMDPATDYEYQLRSYCNGSFTSWSDTSVYNTAFSVNDYIVHILGERCENDTTVRIYWLKTPQISNLQIRYREYGTGTWIITGNATGFKVITGLSPQTLYEYQYRAYIGSAWDQWYPSYLYFYTENPVVSGLSEQEISRNKTILYPVPSTNKISWNSETAESLRFTISDMKGQCINEGITYKNEIDISILAPGVYFLKLQGNKSEMVSKFIKQ